VSNLRVFEGFAGIGAVSKAISRLGTPYQLVGFSEIDDAAVKSFCAIHNVAPDLNYGDICLIDETKLPDFDLFATGFPCQDFSVAGKQKGSFWTCDDCGSEYNPLDVHYSEREVCPSCTSGNIQKSRSSLVVEALRIVRYKRPKYLLIENVKNLINKQFKSSFDRILSELNEYGYSTNWQVLNAKDYGTPQRRERVFVLCVRSDIDIGTFTFPTGFDSGVRLKDILESQVDDKYYLSPEELSRIKIELKSISDTNRIIKYDVTMPVTVRKYEVDILSLQTLLRSSKARSKFTNKQIADHLGVPMTLVEHWFRTDRSFSIPDAKIWHRLKKLLNITDNSFDKSITTYIVRDGVYDKANRIYDSSGIAPTLTRASANEKILIRREDGYDIRRLTPKEAWLLMGFDATDFDKAQAAGVSDAQLYKQAGNSIDVNCLYRLFKTIRKFM